MSCAIDYICNLLKQICCHSAEKGRLMVAAGQSEILVKTKCHPWKVWLSCRDCGHQVCGADVNMFGVSLVPDGFVLTADVKSDKCVVDWQAECGCGHSGDNDFCHM